jgi:restriction system protein
MAIPKFSEIREPALRLLSNSDAIKMKDFISPLAEHFTLTDEEVNLMYPTGNGPIFYDRINWTLSYLFMAGLVEKPKRGVYRITSKGKEMLKTPDKINDYVDKEVAAREPKEAPSKKTGSESDTSSIDNQTPKELLYQSYTDIKENVYTEILTTILSKTPVEFEKLVVSLLQKMGYGGEIKDSGMVTKVSNDEGIDGIIKEDILGFGRIHIQAKRYKLDVCIGREDIQKFVGALAVAQSNKGVFITTSRFAKTAVDYVKNLNGSTTIVLIDGQKLAEYIYDYGLGMQVEQVIEVKKLDADYWDSMKDDEKL